MTCDPAEDRTLLLSRGLFGIPAGRDERVCEVPARAERELRDGEEHLRRR